MPLPDPRAGSLFICVTTFVLLLAIVGGGICLILYISLPQTEAPSWLPVSGVFLVCLPWLFWLVTILYRLISRTCGFRIGGYVGNGARGGGGSVAGTSNGGGGGGAASVQNAATDRASEAAATTSPATSPGGSRRVHFGAAVVVGEQDGQDSVQKKENQMSSSNSSNDISINSSNESEIPLALSMAS